MKVRWEEVKCLIEFWQLRLRLTEWKIGHQIRNQRELKKIVRENNLPRKNPIYGLCLYNKKEKRATIYIWSNIPYKALELTIVHELLHLVFSNFSEALDMMMRLLKVEGEVIELLIDKIAIIFIRNVRKNIFSERRKK